MRKYTLLSLVLFVIASQILSCTGPKLQKSSTTEKDAAALKRNEQIRIFEKRIRELIGKGILPIIDVEFHYGRRIEIKNLIKKMDENGVALVWLAPSGDSLGSEESLRLNELFPDRIVPTTVSGDGKLWHSSDWWFLKKLTTDVRSGRFFAMGEFEGRHYHAGPSTSPDAHMAVDSKAMKVVFGLSEEKNIPFLLHHEAEDKLLPELEIMLKRYPGAKVIWCHFGRNRNPNTWKRFRKAEAAREFLQNYPNLFFNFLESPPGAKFSGFVEGILYDISSRGVVGVVLEPEWKVVVEEFPHRFVLGSDAAPLRFEGWYDRVFYDHRRIILQSVRKDVAEKIAYKNAWKLMTGENWKDN